MNIHWLLRMAQWARNPPSGRQVVVVLAILVFCLAVYAAEQFGLLPDFMQAERMRTRF